MNKLKNNQKFVGVDLGGESGRVMLGAFDGDRITLEEIHRFTTGGTEVGETLRWDVDRLWSEIQTGISIVGDEKGEVTSVGVDTWGVDYVLLDKSDQMLGMPYHYRDKRNVGTLSQINQTLSKSEIFARTGIQFMEINTICQLFAASKTDELENAESLLTIPDYFHWRLSGFKGNEFTNATTTQCFDPTARSWAGSMLESIGIPTRFFCDIVEPGSQLGRLQGALAEKASLKNASVVAPATHDTASAVVAVPADTKKHGKNWAYISSGTWSLVGVEIDKPILSKEALAINVTNEGGVDGTWRLLKNVMGLWIVQQTKRAFGERGFDRDYGELTTLAKESANESYIDPDDPSFLNPENMEVAVLDFLKRTGQQTPASEGSLIRCVLESLALRYRSVLNEIEKLAGLKMEVIHVVGGGSQNGLLNQLIANATGVPVVAGPAESTVMGNVLIQCKAAGGLNSLAEIREVVRNSSDLCDYEPDHELQWQDKAQRFDAVCSTAKSNDAR